MLKNYKLGKKKYSSLNNLALRAKFLGDNDIASDIARDYINNYMSLFEENELYTKANITFIQDFLSPKEKYFNLFYSNGKKIDSAMNESGYAQAAVDKAIYGETILPPLKLANESGKDPDWDEITKVTKEKYGPDYANRNILTAKIRWYEYKTDWPAYVTFVSERINQYKERVSWPDLNSYAWNIFLHSSEKPHLDTALNWSDQSIELASGTSIDMIANLKDTKANLLYKLGRKDEALALEKSVLAMFNEQKNTAAIKQISNTIEKMTKGEPTWTPTTKATE